MPYINQAWAQASPGVKRLLFGLLTVAVIPFAITFGIQAWRDSRIQGAVDQLITKQDLNEQTETLQTGNLVAVDSVVNDAIASYDLLMRQYMAEEREQAIDTILVPLLKQLRTLSEVQNKILSKQSNTDERVRELPVQFDQKLTQMIEAVAPMSQEDKINEILRQNDELKEELNLMKEEFKSGRKTQKQRF